MEEYIFVCIGTNQLVEDSFGPRVGEVLEEKFKTISKVKVLGTMKCPIHFQNAPIFVDYLKTEKSRLIVIDSALGEEEQIGNTYMNRGGIEIGKAFGKSFYFPAHWNIKTIVGKKTEGLQKEKTTYQINQLAQKLGNQIVEVMKGLI
ncbi:MAG: DUF1256 domain-containing protein [Clostridia bacterium]|jgi:putative sporulation protein YyaC|nr:DUF1256 domain-containing protein [Clostridia bacterium]